MLLFCAEARTRESVHKFWRLINTVTNPNLKTNPTDTGSCLNYNMVHAPVPML